MGSIFRIVTRLTPAAFIPLRGQALDQVRKPETDPTTGAERLERMFRMRTEDGVSVELNMVLQSSMMGGFIGACFGGFVRSRHAYTYFIENNQATIFKSTMEAKKKLQHYVTYGFCQGAYRWGWRLALFVGIYNLISTMIRVYRDEHSLTEYLVAGAVTGALFKINMGVAATLVGTVLGTVLSAVFGGLILLCLKVTGANMDDIQRAMFMFREFRERHYNEALEKAATNKNDEVTRGHAAFVDERGEQKIDQI